MEFIGSLFLVLALALVVALFIARPFLQRTPRIEHEQAVAVEHHEHVRSSLLAERDRLLTALQELDFDFALGKVPEEEYPAMRAALLRSGAHVLRQLDQFEVEGQSAGSARSVEERIEAAVAARRADATRAGGAALRGSEGSAPAGEAVLQGAGVAGSNVPDPIGSAVEDMVASRKRARQESAAGFCPGCGRPFQKSDKFCSKCGKTLSDGVEK